MILLINFILKFMTIKIVRKVLRSLSERFRPYVIAIEENNDLNKIKNWIICWFLADPLTYLASTQKIKIKNIAFGNCLRRGHGDFLWEASMRIWHCLPINLGSISNLINVTLGDSLNLVRNLKATLKEKNWINKPLKRWMNLSVKKESVVIN